MDKPFFSFTKEQLIEKLGLSKFPQEVQAEFLDRSLKLIDKRIKFRLLEALSDERFEEFRKTAKQGSEEATVQWLFENVPAVKDWLEEEIEWVRKNIITA